MVTRMLGIIVTIAALTLWEHTQGYGGSSVTRCYDCNYDPGRAEGKSVSWHESKKQRGFARCALKNADDEMFVNRMTCGSGRCFIRWDQNGLVYRGCADQGNLPWGTDTSLSCHPQGKKPSIWWFCRGDRCNAGGEEVCLTNNTSSGQEGMVETVYPSVTTPRPQAQEAPVPETPTPGPSPQEYPGAWGNYGGYWAMYSGKYPAGYNYYMYDYGDQAGTGEADSSIEGQVYNTGDYSWMPHPTYDATEESAPANTLYPDYMYEQMDQGGQQYNGNSEGNALQTDLDVQKEARKTWEATWQQMEISKSYQQPEMTSYQWDMPSYPKSQMTISKSYQPAPPPPPLPTTTTTTQAPVMVKSFVYGYEQPPSKSYQAPQSKSYQYEPQEKSWEPPSKTYDPEPQSKSWEPPAKSWEPPSKTYDPEPQSKSWEPAAKSWETPSKSYESESSSKSWELPSQSYEHEPSSKSYQPPSKSYQPPSKSYESPTKSDQPSKSEAGYNAKDSGNRKQTRGRDREREGREKGGDGRDWDKIFRSLGWQPDSHIYMYGFDDSAHAPADQETVTEATLAEEDTPVADETFLKNPCDHVCDGNPSGLFPHPTHRSWFIQCGNWMFSGKPCTCCKPYYLRCPLGTAFDSSTRVCSDLVDSVGGSKSVY